jgi:trehalose utilization protein
MPIHVTVWNENVHGQARSDVAEVYPAGIHGAVADGLRSDGYEVRTATLQEAEHGLTGTVSAPGGGAVGDRVTTRGAP